MCERERDRREGEEREKGGRREGEGRGRNGIEREKQGEI
jgi:hypothetical protein